MLTPPDKPRTPHTTLVLSVACAVLAALTWFVAAERVRYERGQAVSEAFSRTSGLAMGLEQHTVRMVRAVEQAIGFVEYEYRRQGAALRLDELLNDRRWDASAYISLAIIDETGMRVVGRHPGPAPSFADRPYFTYHRDRADGGLYIGSPLLGRVTGRWGLHFSRRIDKPDGSFGGIILVVMAPDQLARFYDESGLEPGSSITVAGLDGVVLARRSGEDLSFGESIAAHAVMRRQLSAPVGHFLTDGRFDGTRRFLSYRRLDDYPLVLAVGLPSVSMLGQVAQRERYYYGFAAAATLLLVLGTAVLAVSLARQRRALERVAFTEARYREIFDRAVEGIFRTTPEGRFLVANPAMARILGYESPARLMAQRSLRDGQGYLLPAKRDEFMRLMEREGSVSGFEYQLVRADGSVRWVSESARAVLDAGGRVAWYEGNLEDIDVRKRAEEALRAADRHAIEGYERLLAKLADLAEALATAPDTRTVFAALQAFVARSAPSNGMIVVLYDAARAQRRCVYAFTAGQEVDVSALPPLPMTDSPGSRAVLTGEIVVTDDLEAAIRGQPVHDIGTEADPRRPQSSLVVPVSLMGRVIGTLEVQSLERSAFTAEHVTALRMAAPLAGMALENARLLEDERRLRLLAEESERRKSASLEAARQSEERFRTVARATADLVWDWEIGADRVWCSEGIHTLFGYPPGEVRDDAAFWSERIHPEDRERVTGNIRRSLGEARESWSEEYRFARHDGSYAFVQLRAFVLRGPDGKPLRVVAGMTDLSERRRAEAARESLESQLRHAQKMEAIGRLAGGVAHDFNNILGAILGNLELAHDEAGSRETLAESLGEIRKAAVRGRDLVQQILSFSRRQPTERKVVSLTDVAEETVKLMRATLPARVRIALGCDPAAPAILGDAGQLAQVLMNLATNSVDAMGGRPGRIDIAIRRLGEDKVEVTFSDDGSGMDAATLERIYEPFFTTKPMGKGTGLGLPVVHGIVLAHGGEIAVESRPGAGCTFSLKFLPAAAGAAAASLPAPPARARSGRGETILYLDDDDSLVFLVERLLTRRGYNVVAFNRQEEALAALRASPRQFQLLVTDYNMPGMSGLDVARAAREFAPSLPVAMASGYITEELTEQAYAAGVRELIFKPNVVEEFCETVQRLVRAG